MRHTLAHRQFVEWLEQPNHTQVCVARVCDVAQSLVSGWKRGDWRPSENLRPAMHVLTGIEPSAWLTDEEKLEGSEAIRRASQEVAQFKARAEKAPPAAVKLKRRPRNHKAPTPARDGPARAASVKRKNKAAPPRARRPRRPRAEPLPPPVPMSLRVDPESAEARTLPLFQGSADA